MHRVGLSLNCFIQLKVVNYLVIVIEQPAYHGHCVLAGEDSGRAALAAVGTWQQQLLLFDLPALQPLLSQDLGEVTSPT